MSSQGIKITEVDVFFRVKLGLVGTFATDIVTFNHGGGRHQWDVPYQEMRLFAQVC